MLAKDEGSLCEKDGIRCLSFRLTWWDFVGLACGSSFLVASVLVSFSIMNCLERTRELSCFWSW